MSWVAVAVGGSALLGAGASIYGANKAADAAAAGGQQAADFQNRALDASIALQRPQLEVGTSALGVLASLYGLQQPTAINFDNLGSGGGHSLYGDGNTPLTAEGVNQAFRDVFGRDADQQAIKHYTTRGAKVGNRDATGIKGQLHDLTGAPDVLGLGSSDGKRRAYTFNELVNEMLGSDEYQDKINRGLIDPWTEDRRNEIFNPQQTQTAAGVGGMDLNSLVAENPLIKFNREQGEQAIARGAAARGLNQSGGTLKDLASFNQDLSGAGVQQFVLNPLFQLAGFGPQAAQGISSATQSTGNNLANIALGTADARGSAYQNAGNTVGNLAGNVSDYFLYKSMFGGG